MQKLPITSVIIFMFGVIVLSACGAAASPKKTVTSGVARKDFVTGGLMYDKWWKATAKDVPAGDQPLWKSQTTSTITGEDTWRCKECHGWDYKGAEGVYGSGSHQTGFPGVLGASSKTDEELLAQLDGTTDPGHDFSPYLQDDQLKMLVAFLKKGMTDTAQYINTDKTVKGGDAEHGKQLFTETCQGCHGEDGKKHNFGSEAEPEYLGTVAADNPWEFWHKVSFGNPGILNMPSALESGWSSQDIADLLAFVQTLPGK